MLAELFALPDGYEVVLGNGGATAFWEVATFGLVRERSQHLSFGEFGAKFVTSVKKAPHLGDPDVITSEPGDAPEFSPKAGIDLYAAPQNETSTGVAIPVRRVHGDAGALTVIDATSGAGGLPVDAREFDTYYFAPQKSFGSDGGLWVALMSPAALQRASEIKESGRYIPPFLDLQTAIDNSVKDQTYNTPALATIVMMAEQVDWFNAGGGLSFATGRSASSAEILYGWADKVDYASPYVADPAKRSAVIGTIDFTENVDAAAAGEGAARQRNRRHRALPQAGPQPAAGRDVPGDRPGRRRSAHRLHRLRDRRARLTDATPLAHDQRGSAADEQDGGQAPGQRGTARLLVR